MQDKQVVDLLRRGIYTMWIDEGGSAPARFYRLKFKRYMAHSVENLVLELRNLLTAHTTPDYLLEEICMELIYLEWLTGNEEGVEQTFRLMRSYFPGDRNVSGKMSYLKGVFAFRSGDSQGAEELFEDAVKCLDDLLYLGKTHNNLGAICRSEHPEKAMWYFERALECFQQLPNEHLVVMTRDNLAELHRKRGDLDRAIELYTESARYLRTVRSMKDLGQSLHNIGVIYQQKGEYDAAMGAYLEAVEIRDMLDDPLDAAWTHLNLGTLFLEMGEIQSAIEHMQKCLSIREESGTKREIGQAMQGMGRIHMRVMDGESARSYLTRALDIFLEVPDPLLTSETLHHLLQSCLDDGLLEEGRKYLQLHHELNARSEEPIVSLRDRLMQGLVLKQSRRARELFAAQEHFEHVLNSNAHEFALTAQAMVELSDLLILELRLGLDDGVLDELKGLLDSMLTRSLVTHSYVLYIRFLLLNSRLLLIDFRPKEALEHLEEALVLCKEKGLLNLHSRVEKEIHSMEEEILEVWSKVQHQDASLIDRINTSSVMSYLRDVASIVQSSG